MREKQIENDRLAQQFEKVSNDLTTHQDLIQVRSFQISTLKRKRLMLFSKLTRMNVNFKRGSNS